MSEEGKRVSEANTDGHGGKRMRKRVLDRMGGHASTRSTVLATSPLSLTAHQCKRAYRISNRNNHLEYNWFVLVRPGPLFPKGPLRGRRTLVYPPSILSAVIAPFVPWRHSLNFGVRSGTRRARTKTERHGGKESWDRPTLYAFFCWRRSRALVHLNRTIARTGGRGDRSTSTTSRCDPRTYICDS